MGGGGGRVSVVTPYKQQVRCIQSTFQMARVSPLPGISTVDSYQGQESDVIIVSTVRAAGYSIGFTLCNNPDFILTDSSVLFSQ